MKNKHGQAALILILLSAAALIFLAITLNWGRIAQTKALLTIAADESASLLASDAASYGEEQKQTYLNDTNQLTEETGILLAIIMIVVAILIAVFFPPASAFLMTLTIASIVMAVANLVLQLVVVQPGITALWNSLQKSQPITQQFYEGGIATALQGAVGDQVNITDYFDSNANGVFGVNAPGSPNDIVSRFALFYTDRLKMLNQHPIPQVVFFYDQLSELMNGESCDQNESDYASYPNAVTLNPACAALGAQYCIDDPIDPACQVKIPDGFQLNDACAGSDPTNPATYSPYCDPCCQPLTVNGKSVRPSSCADQSQTPSQCLINNPYGAPYYFLYDPAFQNYGAGISFLDQFGRDQQMGTPLFTLTPDVISANGVTPVVEFPDGIFPFFWLTDAYSLEVDNINSSNLQTPQVHWCAAGGSIPSSGVPPAGFSDLDQLTLPYTCQGQDCCVNYLAGSVTNGVPTPSAGTTIDMVGSPSFGSNLGANPSFGEGGTGSWLQGDNQMCLTTWPYNGANSDNPDGTCELAPAPPLPSALPLAEPPSTLDALDDTMHTLSDFVKFSDTFLSNDVQTLSSTFQTWFPQADAWIDPSTGRLPQVVANLSAWDTLIANWLNQTYTSNSAWCVPQESTLLSENGATEDNYINSNSDTTTWGDLPHVIACLNYNASSVPANNYQQCVTALAAEASTCSAVPAQCAPSLLGRSLAGAAPAFTANTASTTSSDTCPTDGSATGCTTVTTTSTSTGSSGTTTTTVTTTTCTSSSAGACTDTTTTTALQSASCDSTAAGSYANWAQNSYTLAVDEAPKFTLRSAFLTDMYTRLQNIPKIFASGAQALKSFLAPCSGTDCSGGGPAAQLIYASTQPDPTSVLPNSVIYGWVDNTYPNGHPGYAHVVKVTAYSPGRGGSDSSVLSVLPWIQTSTSGFLDLTRSYTLVKRDGYVYVSVKRWDEDHSNSLLFPNGHPLWQMLFHNPNGGLTTTGQGLMQVCNGLTLTGGSGGNIGFGLEPQTVAGLGYANISSQDQTALANAFMLNDNVNGNIDPNAKTSGYAACLSAANQLLTNAPESHICAQYIASRNASGPSGNGASDYSLKFVSCGDQPEDLAYTNGQL